MRQCPLVLVLAGLALAPLTLPLAAQPSDQRADPPDSIDPDRPDFTEGTGVIPLGKVQVETGYTYSRVEDEGTSALGEILVRVPFNERVEARIGVGSYDWIGRTGPNGEGYEDPLLGLKVRLNDDTDPRTPWRPEVALLFLTTIPAGSHELTADAWQPTVKLALGWDLTKRFSLSSNLNLSSLRDGGQRFSQVALSVSAGYSLTERLDSFFEVFGFSREEVGGPVTRYADTGLAYAVNDNLKLDVRVGFGNNDAHPDYFVGAGAGFRW